MTGNDKPPDEYAAMDTGQQNDFHATTFGDKSLRSNFTEDNFDDLNPPRKRIKARSSTQAKGPSPADIHGLVDENLLPLVDTSNKCAGCHDTAKNNQVIRCCCCNKRFHAVCNTFADNKVRGHVVMPPRTGIENYHSGILRNVNGDYLGGRFSWTCSSCLNLSDASDSKSLPDRLAVIESVLLKNTLFYKSQYDGLKETLDTLQAQMSTLVSQNASSLPGSYQPRASSSAPTANSQATESDASPSWALAVKGHGSSQVPHGHPSGNSASSTPILQNNAIQTTEKVAHQMGTTSFSANYRIHLEKEESDKPLIKVLEKLALENKIKDYDYRARGRNAMDLLFKAADECHRAYSDLDDVFKQEVETKVAVSRPELTYPNKTYFVGIPAGVSKEKLHKRISEMYPELRLDSVNEFSMKIFDPKPCLKDKSNLRSTVFLSDELYNFFTNKLGNRISLGNYTRLGVYDCISRCVKCQSFEHSFERCRKKESVCATCGGNHYTRKCPHADDKDHWSCVNCANSTAYKGDCKGHRASDSCCPVYKDFKKRQN